MTSPRLRRLSSAISSLRMGADSSECRTVRQVVAIAPLNSFAEMHAKTFYVLASRATHRAVFFTDCKEAFKEAVLRPGERVAVWDYENRDQKSAERDESAGSR